MRRDPIDIERSARHELAEMTRRVRTELDTSVMSSRTTVAASNQMVDWKASGDRPPGGETRGTASRSRRFQGGDHPNQEAATKLSSILEDHNRSVTDQAAEATRKLTETTDKLSTIIDKSVAVEGVGARLGETRKPEDLIRLELNPAVDAIGDMD